MGIVQFNPEHLVTVGNSLNDITTSIDGIKESINSIKNISFSYSPSTSSNISEISSKVDDLIQKVTNLNMSYSASSKLLLDLINQNSDNVKNNIVTYNDKSIEDAIGFYFNYPEASEKIRPITEDELRSIFEKNGAKCYFRNTYEFEVDGIVYRYNVKYPYTIECYKDGKLNGSMSCNFFISTNTSFEDIKNTITIMCGTDTQMVPESLNTMNINRDTIVAVGYGNNGSPELPQVVSGITRTCNYLAGYNQTGSLNNSIVGYSLGGIAAFSAASNNPGLYSKIVTVNSASSKLDNSKEYISNYEALAGIEIIMIESNNDKFESQAMQTIKNLKEHGLGDNVSFYTNSHTMEEAAKEQLGSDHVYFVPEDFTSAQKSKNRGWNEHGHGYEMLIDINIFSYLSA